MSENRTRRFANPVDETAERHLFRDLRKIVFLNVSPVSDWVPLGYLHCTERRSWIQLLLRCTVVKRDGGMIKIVNQGTQSSSRPISQLIVW